MIIVTPFKQDMDFTRQEAAELLTDIAYALVVGGPLRFRIRSEQIDVPIADELLLACRTRSSGGRAELELTLSSSVAASPTTSAA
jgi:amphi-Trp domain-containing protein